MTTRPPELITSGFLARELRRSTADVRSALGRYGIRPAAVAGNVNVYHPDVLLELRRIFDMEGSQQRQRLEEALAEAKRHGLHLITADNLDSQGLGSGEVSQ